MPDAEIAALQARMDNDGLIILPPLPASVARRAYVRGDKVKIVGGAFDGLAGVHSGLSAGEREIVLLRMLNARRRVAVPMHLVHPAPSGG